MGLTKSDIFTEEQNNLAKVAKVLGHPARITILSHLVERNTCICGDLVEEIGLAQATISQHLKELKSIGLIKGSIEGTSVCYCIDPSGFEIIKNYFTKFFASISKQINSCC